MHVAYFFIVLWIIVFVIGWVFLRRRRPDILGIRQDVVKHKTDNESLEACPVCGDGHMEPRFSWWRYCFGVVVPPRNVYVFGSPEKYRCVICSSEAGVGTERKLFTRLSLVHGLDQHFFVALSVNVVVASILFYLYFRIAS